MAKNPAAVALGSLGGSVKSERKAAAARLNGKTPKRVKSSGRPKGAKDKQPRKRRTADLPIERA